MNKLLPGFVTTLEAARKAPFGYFLTNGREDVLLHESQIKTEIILDESYEVFLYQDRQGRLAATQTIPDIQVGRFGWCDVADAVEDLGAFVNIGIDKDILIHKNDLPKLKNVWPEKGARLYCTLKNDRFGNLLAEPAGEEEMKPLFKNADSSSFNQNTTGLVYRTLRSGTFVITEDGYRGFIHESQRITEPRLGQKVKGRIINVKDDGTVNISLLQRGYEKMDENAEKVYRYLLERGGAMPYSDKSQPEDIRRIFGMSKAEFKRALGRLMKENKIVQEDGFTKLKEK